MQPDGHSPYFASPGTSPPGRQPYGPQARPGQQPYGAPGGPDQPPYGSQPYRPSGGPPQQPYSQQPHGAPAAQPYSPFPGGAAGSPGGAPSAGYPGHPQGAPSWQTPAWQQPVRPLPYSPPAKTQSGLVVGIIVLCVLAVVGLGALAAVDRLNNESELSESPESFSTDGTAYIPQQVTGTPISLDNAFAASMAPGLEQALEQSMPDTEVTAIVGASTGDVPQYLIVVLDVDSSISMLSDGENELDAFFSGVGTAGGDIQNENTERMSGVAVRTAEISAPTGSVPGATQTVAFSFGIPNDDIAIMTMSFTGADAAKVAMQASLDAGTL